MAMVHYKGFPSTSRKKSYHIEPYSLSFLLIFLPNYILHFEIMIILICHKEKMIND